MDFSQALELCKDGQRITRKNWNGKGMFVFYVAHWTPLSYVDQDKTHDFNISPFLAMKNVAGNIIPWVASQTDILGDDWVVLT